ncbi:MAG: hypothetical protein MI750_04535 [Xanthomonadales bacterium]|nr:hypothetical protein [Xanthomonadales bacterium]
MKTTVFSLSTLGLALVLQSSALHASVSTRANNVNGDIAGSNDINPNGMFFNRFSGGFPGTEWFQTFPIAGTNRFRMADIFNGGFSATITPDGVITLDNGIGGGSFSEPDRYVINPNIGGTGFTFVCNRAPFTGPDFPLMLQDARPANALFAGSWINQRERVDPEFGTVTALGEEALSLVNSGNTLRLTDPGGGFFQGVYENGKTIVFRRIVPEPSDPRFASYPGSSLSLQQNLIGVVRFLSINEFEAVFLLQTRAPLGSQNQNMFRYRAVREVPLAPGDIDGNGSVDANDRALLVQQLGLSVEDDAYNLAADLDLDDDVDNDDLMRFDNAEVVFVTGFEADDVLLTQHWLDQRSVQP